MEKEIKVSYFNLYDIRMPITVKVRDREYVLFTTKCKTISIDEPVELLFGFESEWEKFSKFNIIFSGLKVWIELFIVIFMDNPGSGDTIDNADYPVLIIENIYREICDFDELNIRIEDNGIIRIYDNRGRDLLFSRIKYTEQAIKTYKISALVERINFSILVSLIIMIIGAFCGIPEGIIISFFISIVISLLICKLGLKRREDIINKIYATCDVFEDSK